MPLDRPTFPGEAIINLAAATLTSSGCTGPAFAIDDDPTTAAVFGSASSAGYGLTGSYYTGVLFNTFVASQIDPTPNLSSLPSPLSPNSTFSAIWSGYLLPQYSEAYTFYISADDGARIYINNVLVASGSASSQGASSPIPMTAGQLVPVRVEYDNVAAPDLLFVGWSSPSTPQQGIPASAYFLSASPVLAPRFLRVDLGYDAFISRIRLAYNGPGAGNVGVDYESSLGYHENLNYAGLPQPYNPSTDDIALSYLPVPADGNVHEVIFNPPVLGRGVVFYPDALLPGPSSQTVNLFELEIYQDVLQGINMANPTVKQARVGCSGLVITPRAYTTATSYPFPQTLATALQSIQNLDFSSTSKLARETGGESVHQLGGYETDREVKCKFAIERHDYLALQNMIAGTLVVSSANGNGPETQYFAPNYGDHAPYFSLVGQSANGDPSALLVMPKCKIDGNLTHNFERDKVTTVEVDFVLFWDALYTRQDGGIGGLYEYIFSNGGATAIHS